jgi:hypothetical protein
LGGGGSLSDYYQSLADDEFVLAADDERSAQQEIDWGNQFAAKGDWSDAWDSYKQAADDFKSAAEWEAKGAADSAFAAFYRAIGR